MTVWRAVELRKIADVVMGQSPPGDTYNNEGNGLPFFQGKADFGRQSPTVSKWSSEPTRVAEAGDILLSVRAPVGPTNVARERSCIGRGLAAIRARERRVEQNYLRLFLRYQERALALRGQGSTFSAINRGDIESLVVPLPPPSEQRRIVEILDQADGLRRLQTEADAKTAHFLPAVFATLLGSPESWIGDTRSRPLHTVADLVGGATPSKQTLHYWDGDIRWITPKDMKQDFLTDSKDHISNAALDETNLTLFDAGTPVIVVRGMILARHVPVALTLRPATVNQDMKALVPKTNAVSGAFLWALLVLAKPRLLSLVRVAGHGTRKLDTPDLRQILVPLPDPDTLEAIESAVQRQNRLQNHLLERRHILDKLSTSLVAKAFDGSLTASWREAHMKELLQEMGQQVKVLAL